MKLWRLWRYLTFSRYVCVCSLDSHDCGAAALATVLLHHGKRTRVGDLREMLQIDAQGTSMRTLQRAAEAVGFRTNRGRVREGVLDNLPTPSILHLNDSAQGHFVVLHKVSKNRAIIADPAAGIRTMPLLDLRKRWSGHALLLEFDSEKSVNVEKHPAVTLFQRALCDRRRFTTNLFFAAAILSLGFGVSIEIKKAVDMLMSPDKAGFLLDLAGGLSALVAGRVICTGARTVLMSEYGCSIQMSLVESYVKSILSKPVRLFDSYPAGDLYARVADVTLVRSAINDCVLSLCLDAIIGSVALSILLWYSRAIGLLIFASIAATFYIAVVATPKLFHLQHELQRRLTSFGSYFIEGIHNIRTIKSLRLEENVEKKINELYSDAQGTVRRLGNMRAVIQAATSAVTGGALVCLLTFGSVLVAEQRLTLGTLILCYSIAGMLWGTIEGAVPAIGTIQQGTAVLERLEDIQKSQSESRPHIRHNFKSLPLRLQCKNVSFEFPGRIPVLADINLELLPGKITALVGTSGSGKTTLAHILAGLYTPTGGCINLNGEDLRLTDFAWLRQVVGIVFQESGLMSGTIKENIRIGTEGSSEAQVIEAAKKAHAHEFITAFRKGYDSNVGQYGGLLSAGQRQRIALARVFLSNRPVLILDEATNALDSTVEESILSELREHRSSLATLLITHRLTTAMRADYCIVMDGGRLAERGTHQQLCALKRRYWSLWTSMCPQPGANNHSFASTEGIQRVCIEE